MDKLMLPKKKAFKGEDGYKSFSVRVKDRTFRNLMKVAEETNRSRNEVVGILLDYALDHVESYEEE